MDDFEQYRKTYAFEIPDEVLLEWLRQIAWAHYDESWDDRNLVEFHPVSDPEDSYFTVRGDHDSNDHCKTSLKEAIKRAYFKLKDKQKEERRKQYEELKKEFEDG